MIRKYEKKDWRYMEVQIEQAHELRPELEKMDNVYSFWDGDVLVGIFWWLKAYEGRFEIYSYISAAAGRHLLAFVREMRQFIVDKAKEEKAVRIEMSVMAGFEPGDRLAQLLGFEYEGTLRKVFKGMDYKLFARIF